MADGKSEFGSGQPVDSRHAEVRGLWREFVSIRQGALALNTEELKVKLQELLSQVNARKWVSLTPPPEQFVKDRQDLINEIQSFMSKVEPVKEGVVIVSQPTQEETGSSLLELENETNPVPAPPPVESTPVTPLPHEDVSVSGPTLEEVLEKNVPEITTFREGMAKLRLLLDDPNKSNPLDVQYIMKQAHDLRAILENSRAEFIASAGPLPTDPTELEGYLQRQKQVKAFFELQYNTVVSVPEGKSFIDIFADRVLAEWKVRFENTPTVQRARTEILAPSDDDIKKETLVRLGQLRKDAKLYMSELDGILQTFASEDIVPNAKSYQEVLITLIRALSTRESLIQESLKSQLEKSTDPRNPIPTIETNRKIYQAKLDRGETLTDTEHIALQNLQRRLEAFLKDPVMGFDATQQTDLLNLYSLNALDERANTANKEKDEQIATFLQKEDLILKAIEAIESQVISGDPLSARLDDISKEGTGYLTQMADIAKRFPDVATDIEGTVVSLQEKMKEITDYFEAKRDMYNTWHAMRPSWNEEPRKIEALPNRSAYDLVTSQTDYILNKSLYLNPKRQRKMVKNKRVLTLQGFQTVSYEETPVGVVMELIDDILEGRFRVAIAGSGGAGSDDDRYVNGRNFHKNEPEITKAIQEESANRSGDGTKYSINTIRSAIRTHTIWTMGSSHQNPKDNPGTSDDFTKAYLWHIYCRKYADKGKDTFIPSLPRRFIGVKYTPDQLTDPKERAKLPDAVQKYQAVLDKAFSKLTEHQRHEYAWLRTPMFNMLPYKSGDVTTGYPEHWGYTVLPLMASLTIGKFPPSPSGVEKTMSFDYVRTEDKERRVWNLMPFVEQTTGPFAGIKPPAPNVLSQYYPDLKGPPYTFYKEILMASPSSLISNLEHPDKIGSYVKYVDDAWIFIRNNRDLDSTRIKEDKRKFFVLLAWCLAEWGIAEGGMKQSKIEEFLRKLKRKTVDGKQILTQEDAEVIEMLSVNFGLELMQEFGEEAGKLVKFV